LGFFLPTYLRDLPNSSTETEELLLDSEAVLKAIELQHGILVERFNGIFSFSFLAFQEYFTARKIVAGYNLRAVEQDLQNLVSHLTEPRWREVFLLTASMLRSADTFMELIKQQIDQIVSEDAYLQKFLTWISQKSIDVTSPSLEATRAFYFGLTQVPRLAQNFSLAGTLDQGIFLDALLDDLISKCQLESANNIPTCREALDNVVTVVIDVGFKYSLQKLKDKLPDLLPNPSKSQAWLQTNYTVWMEELREKIIQYRNLKQDWNLSPQQQQTLECYYKANQLLLDCLNSTCEVTEAVRLEIQASLLLSTVELDQREWS
jgi:predicted NACHT family NTPase